MPWKYFFSIWFLIYLALIPSICVWVAETRSTSQPVVFPSGLKKSLIIPLQEINDSCVWINKTVYVEGRLYVYMHLGFIYQGAIVDYILVDSSNNQIAISSNGIPMPIAWTMNNVPSVANGVFSGPNALVLLCGIVRNTTAGDLGLFWPQLYISTLNVYNITS